MFDVFSGRLTSSKPSVLVIKSQHEFADTTARDAYFVTNPDEKTTGLFIAVGTDFQQWSGTAWIDRTAVIRGPQGIQGIQGEQGIQGIQGEQGIQGIAGADGADGGGGVTDHGALTGLADDDHPQYQRKDAALTTTQLALLTTEGIISIPAEVLGELTVTQRTALVMTQDKPGFLPGPTADDIANLRIPRADGTWIAQPGGSGSISGLVASGILFGADDGTGDQDNTFVWKTATGRFGVNTSTPTGEIDLRLKEGTVSYEDIHASATAINYANSYSTPTLSSWLWDGLYPDLNVGSNWFNLTGPGSSGSAVGYTFAVQRKVRTVSISFSAMGFTTFKIQSSDDGTTWTDRECIAWSGACVQSGTNASATGVGLMTVTLDATVAAYYWRMVIIANATGYSQCNELRMTGVVIPAGTFLLCSDGNGNLGRGTQTPQASFDVHNTANTLSLRVYRPGSTDADYIASFHSNKTSSGLVQAAIRVDGQVVSRVGSFGSFSDVKLKENIVDLSPKLDKLLQVRPVKFNLIGDQLEQCGVIAQELEQIFPGLVDVTDDYETVRDPNWVPKVDQTEANRPWIRIPLGTTTKSVKYSVFITILIKALQEAHAKIVALESRVTALDGQ